MSGSGGTRDDCLKYKNSRRKSPYISAHATKYQHSSHCIGWGKRGRGGLRGRIDKFILNLPTYFPLEKWWKRVVCSSSWLGQILPSSQLFHSRNLECGRLSAPRSKIKCCRSNQGMIRVGVPNSERFLIRNASARNNFIWLFFTENDFYKVCFFGVT